MQRLWVTCLWMVTCWIFFTLCFLVGLFSMRRLGRALETIGKNLQAYDW